MTGVFRHGPFRPVPGWHDSVPSGAGKAKNASEAFLRHEIPYCEPMIEKNKKTSQKRAVSGTRKKALELLGRLFRQPEDSTPLPVMLVRQSSDLDGRDASMLAELVYGVLRRHALLDVVLTGFLKKPEALSAQVRMLLRIGTYELLFMDGIPARATVHEWVELARRRFGQGMGGLVNGVLRSVDRESDVLRHAVQEKMNRLSRAECDAEGVAEAASLPLWLTRMWVEQYGRKAACFFAEKGEMRRCRKN